MPRQLHREDYTVGWVCALPIELAAAQEMLDEEHDNLERDLADNDENLYALGSIGRHNVAIVCLPAGLIGNNPAAAVATQMRATFKGIRFGLMVGIGGGVPSKEVDIRLGDVIVSQPNSSFSGVVQYDMGKATLSGFQRTGLLNSPPLMLLAAVSQVQANEHRGKSKLAEYVSKFERVPKFQRSKAGPDVLFESTYEHVGGQTCSRCNADRQKDREPRSNEVGLVVTHYGTIASGNQVMRNAAQRDRVSADLGGVLCFEMEAAGLMNNFPCLVVRGVCDYADSHKNKQWQAYAAGTAAAWAKELLSVIPADNVAETRAVDEAIRETGGQEEKQRPLEKRATPLVVRTRNLDQHETNGTQFGCEGCDRKFTQKEAVNQHVAEKKEDHWPRSKCRKCDAEFGSDQAAHEHRKAKSHWPPNIFCQKCPKKKFTTLDAVQQHLHTSGHQGLKISCKMCLLSFENEEAANRHTKKTNHWVF